MASDTQTEIVVPPEASVPLDVMVLSVPTTEVDRIHHLVDQCDADEKSAAQSAATATAKAAEAAATMQSIQVSVDVVTEKERSTREAANEAGHSKVAAATSEHNSQQSEDKIKAFSDNADAKAKAAEASQISAERSAVLSENSAVRSTEQANISVSSADIAVAAEKSAKNKAEEAQAAQMVCLQGANTATAKAQESIESANASETSNQQAKKHLFLTDEAEKKAYNHAAHADVKAQEAGASQTASAQSEQRAREEADRAAERAVAAQESEKKADDKAKQAQKYRVGAMESADLSEKWATSPRNEEIEAGKFSAKHWAGVAEQYAGPAVNTLVWRGQWDASKGAPPTPTPETPDFYKVTVEGDINGVHYEPGDTIIWDIAADEWFRLRNSERPISDDLDLDSSVTAASSRAVMLLENKKADKHEHPYRSDTWVPGWDDIPDKPDTATRWQGWDELSGKPSAYPSSAHDHDIGEVTGLQDALDAKADNHDHPYKSDSWVPGWDDVTGKPDTATRWPTLAEVSGKPATYPPDDHDHEIDEINGLQTALDGKSDKHDHPYRLMTWNPTWDNVTGKPDTATRWPTWDEVTGIPITANRWPTWGEVSFKPDMAIRWPTWDEVTGKPSSFTPASHAHAMYEIGGLETALNGKEPTLAADRKRKITISTANPSGGSDGDIWFKY